MIETAWQRYVADGGIMMFFLIPLALLMVAFTIQGFINLRRNRVVPRNFQAELDQIVKNHQGSEALRRELTEHHHSLAHILTRVLEHLEFKLDADPAEILSETIEEECTSLQQRNSQLSVIYNIAPLGGLLGTVFGMITTFRDFALSDNPSVRQLSEGIDVALLTTAWGLSIAIPAFIFLYFFTQRINTYEQVVLPREGQVALQKILIAIGFTRTSRTLIPTQKFPSSEEAPRQKPEKLTESQKNEGGDESKDDSETFT